MKHFTFTRANWASSRLLTKRIAYIGAASMSAVIVAMLAACGGSAAPEPKTIELFMQSGGMNGSQAGGSCAFNAQTFASRQRLFEQDVLQNDLKLKVVSSECRYLPQAEAQFGGRCAAQYRYVIAAEGAIQNRNDILVGANDGGYLYAPGGMFDSFSLFPWGTQNNTTQGPNGVFEVKFPPKFTAGYIDCGG